MKLQSPAQFAAYGACYGIASASLLLVLSTGLSPTGRTGVALVTLIYVALLVAGSAWLGIQLGHRVLALEREAWLDPHTGLANRRAGDRALLLEESLARRKGRSLALLVLDIDDLKAINDSQGHLAGDRALRAVGLAVGRVCRETDLAIRWGGDEFVMLARDTEAPEALAIARRIQRALGMMAARVTVSVGVAVSKASEGSRPGRLFDTADRALYAAKRSGRSGVELGVTPERRQPAASERKPASPSPVRVWS